MFKITKTIDAFADFVSVIVNDSRIDASAFVEAVASDFEEVVEFEDVFTVVKGVLNYNVLDPFMNSLSKKYHQYKRETNCDYCAIFSNIVDFVVEKLIRMYKKTSANNSELNRFLRYDFADALKSVANREVNYGYGFVQVTFTSEVIILCEDVYDIFHIDEIFEAEQEVEYIYYGCEDLRRSEQIAERVHNHHDRGWRYSMAEIYDECILPQLMGVMI